MVKTISKYPLVLKCLTCGMTIHLGMVTEEEAIDEMWNRKGPIHAHTCIDTKYYGKHINHKTMVEERCF